MTLCPRSYMQFCTFCFRWDVPVAAPARVMCHCSSWFTRVAYPVAQFEAVCSTTAICCSQLPLDEACSVDVAGYRRECARSRGAVQFSGARIIQMVAFRTIPCCHIRTSSTSSSHACTGNVCTLVEKKCSIALFADGTFGAVDKRKITRPDGSICYVAVKRLKKHNTSEKVCAHARTCCTLRTDAHV